MKSAVYISLMSISPCGFTSAGYLKHTGCAGCNNGESNACDKNFHSGVEATPQQWHNTNRE